MSLTIGKHTLKSPYLLAPLAGFSDISFRDMCRSYGAGLTYTEMVSAKGLIYDNDKTWEYTKTVPGENPVAVQLFGGDIDDLVKATKMVCEKDKPDIIDLNMGCPVKKVLKQGAGSMLLQTPDKIYELVKAVVEASSH